MNRGRWGKWVRAWGIVAVLGTVPSLSGWTQEKPEKPDSRALATLEHLQEAFATVADAIEPAVVTIVTSKTTSERPSFLEGRRSRRATGTGSGVIIAKEGWVLTNDHVVGGAEKVTVKLQDGREIVGAVRRDFRSDLALVKIEDSKPFPFARLGDSDKVKIGHWAIAIGSPYKYEGSFSVGVISSLYRPQKIQDLNSFGMERIYPQMFQTDAAINPGNSGGPLCNLRGEVIAINTAIESENGGSVGIGFAIPINAAKFVIKQLMENGKVRYGYLGVMPTTVTPRTASSLKVDRGAMIQLEPEASSPAAKAGLHAGDVITSIGMRPVRNEYEFRTIVAQTLPGTTLELTIVRDGKEQTLKAELTEAPDRVRETPKALTKATLGIEVQPLTERLAERAGVSPQAKGVVIKSIDPESGAGETEELLEGALILKVNGMETPTVADFQKATANLQAGDQVRLLLEYRRAKRFVIVPVE